MQIFRSLRTAGWVESVRGSQGGYRLIVRPEEICLLEIAEIMGYQDQGHRTSGKTSAAETMLQEVWEEMSHVSREVLTGIRLSDLAERYQSGEAAMFYI